jgi:hypothetical protein
MFLFDPRVGTGAYLRRLMLAEITFNTDDMLAEAGHAEMADAYWQMAVMLSHPSSS